MSAVVETDSKGRILIPAEMRRRLHTNRFKVTEKGALLELEPLPRPKELRGKYRRIIKSEWDQLEEKGEEFVEGQRR